MKQRYRLYRRPKGGVFYCQDNVTGRQESLATKNRAEARTILAAKNEAHRQPALNLTLARTYLSATDPHIAHRTWRIALEELASLKQGANGARWQRAIKDRAFDAIRHLPILETRSEHFLQVLKTGTVATNVFLRRIHNFCLDMNWLPCPVIPKRQWPKVQFGKKRAITATEHANILLWETNPERRAFYELAWHLGAAQSDLAALTAENIDWDHRVIRFFRKKTHRVSVLRFGDEVAGILSGLPSPGPLFPHFATLREAHRSTEFRRACRRAGVDGVTLHSYRYAWAERAKACGYPERFAQSALGHNSRAVHEAYAGAAIPVCPPLDEYEKSFKEKVIPMPLVVSAG